MWGKRRRAQFFAKFLFKLKSGNFCKTFRREAFEHSYAHVST
jgi:hypothetical protein